MAYNATTGKWEQEDASVSNRVTGLMSKNNPYMQQARTRGMQSANRRGLLNSSMAVGAAEGEAYSAAVPIASQEASQVHQRNMQQGQFDHDAGQLGKQIESQEKLGFANIAAHDREKAAALAAAMENSYAEMFRTIGQNADLPAAVRDKYLQHAGTVRDNNLRLVEQLYGITLDWETPTV